VRSREALRLDARLLVDREHQRVRWRVEVQAAHLAAALLEVRLIEICHHPVLGPVRADLRPAQDHVRLGLRDPDLLTQLAVRPALPTLPRLGLRRARARLCDQHPPPLWTIRLQTPRSRPIPQPLDPIALMPRAPAVRQLLRAPHPLSDLARREALRRAQHDLGALPHPPLRPTRANDPLELRSILRADHNPLADHRSTSIIAHQNDNEFAINSQNSCHWYETCRSHH